MTGPSTSAVRVALAAACAGALSMAAVIVLQPVDVDGTPVAAPSPTAQADPRAPGAAQYVHMGDSYGAGTGPFHLTPGVPVNCQRTLRNPGHQVAARLGWTLRDVTCASAKTQNLHVEQYFGAPPQLDALGPDTEWVTVVLGANDGDVFDTLVKRCAAYGDDDPTGSPCRDAIGDDLLNALRQETGPNLRQAYRDITAAAPNARVFAVGYPWIVPKSGACRPAMRFADGDIVFAREAQALLNQQVKKAAEAAGAEFIDMASRSEGHDACQEAGVRWIEPAYDASTLEPMGLPSMHPNPLGQKGMADAMYDRLKKLRR